MNADNKEYTFADMDELWEDFDYDDESVLGKLFKNSTGKDYYFHVSSGKEMGDDEAFAWLTIVPKAYYDKHQCLFDQSMPIDHLLPEDCTEEMESVWASEMPAKDLRQEMLFRGFQESKALAEDCRQAYDFDKVDTEVYPE
jgi:hypothetical protein